MSMIIVDAHFSSSGVFVVVIIVALATCAIFLRHSCCLLPYLVVWKLHSRKLCALLLLETEFNSLHMINFNRRLMPLIEVHSMM